MRLRKALQSAVRRTGMRKRVQGRAAAVLAVTLAMVAAPLAGAADGTVTLARKYRPGQTMVYATEVRSRAKVESNPPDLKNFFPPVPPDLTLHQQNTVKVTSVHPDGAADIEHRFDRFQVEADLASFPESLRDSTEQAQREFTERLTGQTLTVHYDREGRLTGFEGADRLLGEIDAPLREPLRQMLRLFLEQMGGQALYPDHPVKPGDEWKQDLNAAPRPDYPFKVRGESTMHFTGTTRFQGVEAGIVEFQFENVLTPTSTSLRQDGAVPELESMGMQLNIAIRGEGKGRVLVALEDGRVLQNHSNLHQTLSAHMEGKEGAAAQPAKLEIQSDTEMNVEGSRP